MSNHSILPLQLGGRAAMVDAIPLEREAFAPFGDVIANPRPQLHPSAVSHQESSDLPFNGLVANQGTAIKYQHVSRMVNLYDQAPSGRPGIAVMNMFVCAARRLAPSSELGPTQEQGPAGAGKRHPVRGPGLDRDLAFPVSILERHPYTTQTFTPLTADPKKRFLVIVAPSLPPSPADQSLPCPNVKPSNWAETRPLPGRGLPDLSRLRAFVATSEQAVTYGAGTWHAPMVALGPVGTAVDFLVVQFANGEAIEDCQEVYLSSPPEHQSDTPDLPAQGNHIMVRIPATPKISKL